MSVLLTGATLTLDELFQVMQGEATVTLDESCEAKVTISAWILNDSVQREKVYGVNTGFGGNASGTMDEQHGLPSPLEGLLAGVVPSVAEYTTDNNSILPPSWVRGAMCIRANTLLRGHSAVRWLIIEKLVEAINKGHIPVVPSHGSISASGDLMPLAYITFGLAGHKSVLFHHNGVFVDNEDAQRKNNFEAVDYQPKELLAMINGTAMGAAVACQAMVRARYLLNLVQGLTAMTCEALMGTRESFDPFLHVASRPHAGQITAAKHLFGWLSDSTMLTDKSAGIHNPVDVFLHATMPSRRDIASAGDIGLQQCFLQQDRYALRTAPQFLGPIIEDFDAAQETLIIEINSSTDNPLVDVESQRILSGGNFQATAITNATEKVRDGLSMLGKLLFAQQSELMNVSLSRGLHGCLAFRPGDQKDGGLKGLDIANAAYASELAWLSSRVNSFIQSAELHNQSVNSLALISARQTMLAVELLTKLCANSLFSVMQAIDLRCAFASFCQHAYTWFKEDVSDDLAALWLPHVIDAFSSGHSIPVAGRAAASSIRNSNKTSDRSLTDSMRALVATMDHLGPSGGGNWDHAVTVELGQLYEDALERRNAVSKFPSAEYGTWIPRHQQSYSKKTDHLPLSNTSLPFEVGEVRFISPSRATCEMWYGIRLCMGIPMWLGPSPPRGLFASDTPSLGEYITIIYRAIRDLSSTFDIKSLLG